MAAMAMALCMARNIEDGTLVFRAGLELPAQCGIKSEFFSDGWQRIVNFRSHDLDRALQKADWTFRYSCPKARGTAFGLSRAQTMARAFHSVLAAIGSQSYNCLELSQESMASFCGIKRVRLSAHARTIQERYASAAADFKTQKSAGRP
jgi:hypothetical protein